MLYGNSFQGLQAAPSTVLFTPSSEDGFSTSVTVGTLTSAYGQGKGGANTVYIVRLVNYQSTTTVTVDMQGLPSSATFPVASDLAVLSSPTSDRTDSNSFTEPRRVAPSYSTVAIKSGLFSLDLPALSLSILRVYVTVGSNKATMLME